MTDAELLAGLRAIIHPARWEIVRLMAGMPTGVQQVELVAILGPSPATMSRHVKVMVEAGVVRRGDNGRYYLVPSAIRKLANRLGRLA